MRQFWGWELATYLFLGGLGGGMLTFAMVLDLIVYPTVATSSILVWGVFIALIVLAVGTGLLVFELGQPKYFYRAFVTKTAVIKWGAVLLSISMIFAVLFILWELTWFTMFPFIPYEGMAHFFLIVAGCAGFCVMVYTGTMIASLKGRPFWATPALPVLFTVSALSTGAACLSLCIGVFPFPMDFLQVPFNTIEGSQLCAQMKGFLHMCDAVLIVLEVLVLLLYVLLQFCASNKYAKAIADRWVRGSWAFLFWGCMLTGGLIIPFFCNVLGGETVVASVVSPVLALAGGLLLRFMILWSCERRLDNGEEKYYTRLPKGANPKAYGNNEFMNYWDEGYQYWTWVNAEPAEAEAQAATDAE
ncbi:MAG: NrfD/PsrC family molybdoenzyme membrane anchor subunit [Coriobacteriales bacterium]|jgi:protein NrfD